MGDLAVAFGNIAMMDEDIRYVLLISIGITVGLGLYWGMSSIFEVVASYLALTLVGLLAFIAGGSLYLRRTILLQRERRKLLESIQSPVFDRYQELRSGIEAYENAKRKVVGRYLLPMLGELIEEKLPLLVRKRDEYAAFLQRSDVGKCNAEIDELTERIAAEEDPDIRRALERNLALTEATRGSYQKIQKMLRLYEIQIKSIEKHLENLHAKLQILDMDDEIKASTERILHGIHADIEDLEQAMLSVDEGAAGEEAEDS